MGTQNGKKVISDLLKLIEKGIGMEINAQQFYRAAADKVSSPQGKEMLMWLSNFEKGHETRLRSKLKQLREKADTMGIDNIEAAQTDLSETGSSEHFPANASESDILKIAIANEKKAYAFFQRKITYAEDPSIEAIFTHMAGEEEHHIKILTDQLEHIKITNMWMDMKEFDNLIDKNLKYQEEH